MPLLLPGDHPARSLLVQQGIVCLSPGEAAARMLTPLRLGIINLMPRAEQYEPMLLAPLGRSEQLVEPVWLRLASHCYASSDLAHLTRYYRDAESELSQPSSLDGLILTGAPVEELAFTEVRYWSELRSLLLAARARVRATLGLCWGGMALAQLLGIEKVARTQKLFGVHALRALRPGHALLAPAGEPLLCAQSRHAGMHDAMLERAEQAGLVRLLAHSELSGHTLFESHDARWQMHLGHPEYTPARLCFEYLRDRELGREDVAAPAGVDLLQPGTRALRHGDSFFDAWLQALALHARP